MPVVMDAARMDPAEAAACRWVGWTITKGVVHPDRDLVAWADEGTGVSQQHGHLIQRYGGVDPCPRCYDRDAPVGFGGFIRVNRFTRPDGNARVFGIDFSRAEPRTIGVATSALDVALVAAMAVDHGTPRGDELALLKWTMCEHPEREAWRRREGLWTAGDWATALRTRFVAGSPFCPGCGEKTMEPGFRFCHQCGSDPRAIYGGA